MTGPDRGTGAEGSRGQDAHLRWEPVSERQIVRNEWIDFRESVWQFPDGTQLGPFYTYHRRDYAVIAALDEEGRYICVRQFRQGIREVTTEFPAGGIEDGEDPLECAKRELREETGYVSGRWTKLARIPSNATISDNYAWIFLAEDCRREAERHLDVTEFVDVLLLDAEKMHSLVREDGFAQAVHVAAYYMAQEHFRSLPAEPAG